MKHEIITMADVQSRYQAKPYGWKEIDVAAVVAQLIFEQKVTIKYAGNTIQPTDSKLIELLRKKSEIAIYVVVDRPNAVFQDDAKFATRIVRAVLTEALPYLNYPMTEELSEKESLALVLYERNDSTVSILEAASSIKNSEGSIKKAAVFCGSEGGLSPQEIQILQEAGFIPVHLKTNILRCETAALYGIASLQSLL